MDLPFFIYKFTLLDRHLGVSVMYSLFFAVCKKLGDDLLVGAWFECSWQESRFGSDYLCPRLIRHTPHLILLRISCGARVLKTGQHQVSHQFISLYSLTHKSLILRKSLQSLPLDWLRFKTMFFKVFLKLFETFSV